VAAGPASDLAAGVAADVTADPVASSAGSSASADPLDPVSALEAALADPPDDLAERARLLDDASQQLRAALGELDGV
jgi:hypothetical protein